MPLILAKPVRGRERAVSSAREIWRVQKQEGQVRYNQVSYKTIQSSTGNWQWVQKHRLTRPAKDYFWGSSTKEDQESEKTTTKEKEKSQPFRQKEKLASVYWLKSTRPKIFLLQWILKSDFTGRRAPAWEAIILSKPSKEAFSNTGHLPWMASAQGHTKAARRNKTSKAIETFTLADPQHRTCRK